MYSYMISIITLLYVHFMRQRNEDTRGRDSFKRAEMAGHVQLLGQIHDETVQKSQGSLSQGNPFVCQGQGLAVSLRG